MRSDRLGLPADDLERQLHHFGLTLEALADEPLRRHTDTGPVPLVEMGFGPDRQEQGPSDRSRRLLAAAVVLALALIGAVLARELRDEPSGPAGLGVDTGEGDEDSARDGLAPPVDQPSTLIDGSGGPLATVSADDDGVLAVAFTGDDPSDNLFVALAVEQLLNDEAVLPGADVHDRRDLLTGGGLEIALTLDPATQQLAADLVDRELTDDAVADGAGAQVATIDGRTGAVRALAVRYDWSEAAVDRRYAATSDSSRDDPGQFPGLTLAEELRQGLAHRDHPTWRAFTPVLQAAALEQGLSPADRVSQDHPCAFFISGATVDPGIVTGGEELSDVSPVTIADLTGEGTNCARLRLGLVVGLDDVLRTAARLGLGDLAGPGGPDLSLTLTGAEAGPADLASAYATLASGGREVTPRFVERIVTPQATVLYEEVGEGNATGVVAPGTADAVVAALRSGQGPMAGAPTLGEHPVIRVTTAGVGASEAWTVGSSGRLATAVWVGDLEPWRRELGATWTLSDPEGITTRIWEAQMAELHTGLEPVALPEADSVDLSGGVDLTPPPGAELAQP